ncbi:hypothetical protein [Kineosporia babensis]|uniref:Uncharacterized protein n=1 Tax=Kineosporia babensis TaxID=499548 RepID=A0A9X1NMK5_9ACTN|nr:hypothetical protein [Kineosporia babensis]MCD5316501.1 hypothetical protein [Kineosporia babensis]
MKRSAALALLLALALTLLAGPAQAAARGPVVLIGTGGLSWNDVTGQQPALSRLQREADLGWLVVRSVEPSTCPIDGWLAVSAGARAAAGDPQCAEPALEQNGNTTTVAGWQQYVDQAKVDGYDAEPGRLGDLLAQAGLRSAAVGAGAAIALAESDGHVPQVWDSNQVRDALHTDPDVLTVDIGTTASQSVQDLDTRLRDTLAVLPTDARVIVASLSDSGTEPELQLLARSGPDVTGSLLGSTATRQDGLAQSTDLFPTILSALDLPIPPTVVGAPLQPVADEIQDRPGHLRDLEQASAAIDAIVPPFFVALIALQALLYLCCSGRWVPRLATAFACVPAATFAANLFPWWRAGHEGLALTAAVLLCSTVMAAVALLGPWRRAPLGAAGAVAAMTMAVLAADVLSGSGLALSALMGLQPVVAGRFYGFGNAAFAVFATASLLTAAAVAEPLVRRGRTGPALAAVAVVGATAVIVDGTPGLGSDFGGPPALIPGFAVLAFLVSGRTITRGRVLALGGLTLIVVTGIGLLDWLRPAEQQTHLGRFVQTLLDGGALTVIERKAALNLHILLTTYLVVLVPALLVLTGYRLWRRLPLSPQSLQQAYRQSPTLRPFLVAFGVSMLIAALLNDSGASIPADASLLVVPLLVAVAARAHREGQRARIGDASGSRTMARADR